MRSTNQRSGFTVIETRDTRSPPLLDDTEEELTVFIQCERSRESDNEAATVSAC